MTELLEKIIGSNEQSNFRSKQLVFLDQNHIFEGNKQVFPAYIYIYTYVDINIIYIYIYMYMYMYTYENAKIYFQICSYIQKTTLSLVETSNIIIYNTKHTHNTKWHFQNSNFLKIPTFSTVPISQS